MSSEIRILIIKLSSLGDIFHALPAMLLLRQHFNAEIHWATQPEYADLVRCFKNVDKVISFPRRHFIKKIYSFLKTLRACQYDYVFDLQGLLKSAFIARASRARNRIGPSFQKEGAHFFFNATAQKESTSVHAVECCLDSVRLFNIPVKMPELLVSFPLINLPEPTPRIVIAPCSRWPAKNWPLERFAELANRIAQEISATFYLIGSRQDIRSCNKLKQMMPSQTIDCSGKYNLVQLGSLLQETQLCVTNDSGPMHMADVLGIPLIALFGPTDPDRVGPYYNRNAVIQPAEKPSRKIYKSSNTSWIEKITVNQVFERVQNELNLV